MRINKTISTGVRSCC